MKVLFIGPLPEPVTGQSLACRILLDALSMHHEVDVVDLNKGGFSQGISSVGRVIGVLRIAWRVLRAHRRCDVIYLTVSESIAGNAKDLLLYLCCFTKLRQMTIHLHGGAGLKRIMDGRVPGLNRLNAFFMRRLGAVIVLGGRHVNVFKNSVERSRIHVVPNFAQDFVFSSVDSIEAKFRSIRNLRILFLSNLIPGKGHLELVEAIRRLDEESQNRIDVDFAGGFENSGDERSFQALIAALPRVRYHGRVSGDAKKRLLAQAHILCLPTYYPYEGQPICILEAYAAGCAVITTDHSGIFDVFEPDINGYVVDKRSPEFR
jgi:glycosyltransferase involved in cell wall biosynthesis